MFKILSKTFGRWLLVLAVAVSLGLTAVLFSTSPAPAAPTITWTPASLAVDIAPGDSNTRSVSFTASEAIATAEIGVVPALTGFVRVSPSSVTGVAKGQAVSLTVMVSASAVAPLGKFDGTIQVRSRGVLARPLPITVNVWSAFADGIGVRIITSPPVDYINTKITIDTFDLEGLSELMISTVGLEKNIGRLVNINWGGKSPNQLGSVTYDLPEIVPPSSLGIDIGQLRELQLLVQVKGNSGKSISATTTVRFQ
jgi:hypothetical protein